MGDDQPSNLVTGLKYFMYLVLLGVIIFIIVEWNQFKNSPIGKGLGDTLGAIGAFATWLAAHPNTLIGLAFTALLVPLAGVILSRTFGNAKELKDEVKKAREAEADGKLVGKDPVVVELAVEKVVLKVNQDQLEAANASGSGGTLEQENVDKAQSAIDATKTEDNVTEEQDTESDGLRDDLTEGF